MPTLKISAVVVAAAVIAFFAWRNFAQNAKPGNQPIDLEPAPTRIDGGLECKYGSSVTADITCLEGYCRDSGRYEDDTMPKVVDLPLVQIKDETCVYEVDNLFLTNSTAGRCDEWSSDVLGVLLRGVKEEDIVSQVLTIAPESNVATSRCVFSLRVILKKQDEELIPFEPTD